jgi:hypothetical protein
LDSLWKINFDIATKTNEGIITKDKGVGGVATRSGCIIAANIRQAKKHTITMVMLNHAIFCHLFINPTFISGLFL